MSKTLVLPMKTRLRVYVQNVSLCTGTTRTYVSTHVRVVPGTHGDVFERTHGDVFSGPKLGFQRVTRTHHDHNDTHNTTQQHDHNTTRRQRQTETDRDRERRQGQREKRRRKRRDKTREEKTKEDKTREERRFISQCGGGAWPFFCWCSDFLVDSVCARDLSLLNSVKYDSI